MKKCEHCGELTATEPKENIAGTVCRCGLAAVNGSAECHETTLNASYATGDVKEVAA